ncbi:MAG: FAD-dependent oxidoreductase [Armatimonadetes bacterium]|nr:FAD-dependent oxidoreductase [Armatimonadota bacterium]
MTGVQRLAETRFEAEVVVVGGGIAAVAAAHTAAATGRSALLATPGVTLADEITTALHGEVAHPSGARPQAVCDKVTAYGGAHGEWIDPPSCELVIDRMVAEAAVRVLYYAVPIALVRRGDRAVGVLMGGKDGFYVIAAGAVVDATADGVLFRGSGVAFDDADEVTASRTVYFQLGGDDVTGLPDEVDGFRLSAVATWPGEVCVTMAGSAPFDGLAVPAALVRRSRQAVESIARAVRESVPGLRDAVVSHTGHTMLPLTGSRLSQPGVKHPTLRNVLAGGGWARADGSRACGLLWERGHEAGMLASAGAEPLEHVVEAVPDPMVEDADVVVVGGGTGGALAGLASARLGARTVLLEAGWFLGGIGTGGGIHCYYHGVRGGLQDTVDEQNRRVADSLGGADKVRGFSAEAKKIVLERLAAEAGVDVRLGAVVADVAMEGRRVVGVVTVQPGRVTLLRARASVDASGDGDVAAQAGAEFVLGRAADQVNHAYTQSAGRLVNGRLDHYNFDAGYVDATDVADLTRARRHGIQLFWRDEGVTAETRLLYLAPLLGLRQSRHVVGDYTVTLRDQAEGRTFDDVIAYGSCHYDNHAFDYENESEEAMFWCWFLGNWWRMMRHGVPYRSLLPHDVEGLVIGCRALSVSHDAHMLFRMQRDMQRVGEAAGAAAALAARGGVTPRQVPAAAVQAALRETGGIDDDWQSALPEATPEALVADLAGDDPGLAAWRLFVHGEAAVPALQAALRAESPEARWFAAGILAMLEHRDGLSVLREALAARDLWRPLRTVSREGKAEYAVRSVPRWVAAIPLLGKLRDRASVPLLAEVLADPAGQADALVAAVRALGRIGDPGAVAVLESYHAERPAAPPALFQDSMVAGRGRVERDVQWQVDLALAEALQALGVEAGDIAEDYAHDERAFVRRYAEQVLAGEPAGRHAGELAAADAAHVRRDAAP